MNVLIFILIGFVWTLISFIMGAVVHRWATREQRRLLKKYRMREQARRQMSQPIE